MRLRIERSGLSKTGYRCRNINSGMAAPIESSQSIYILRGSSMKKLLILLSVVVLALAFGGCGNTYTLDYYDVPTANDDYANTLITAETADQRPFPSDSIRMRYPPKVVATHQFNVVLPQTDSALVLTSADGLILTQVGCVFAFPVEMQQFNFTITGNTPENTAYLVRGNGQVLSSITGFAYTFFHDGDLQEFVISVEFFSPPWDTPLYRNDNVVNDITTNFKLDTAIRNFFDSYYDAIQDAFHLIDIYAINYAAANGIWFDYAPELVSLSDSFVEAFIQGFEEDDLARTFPFNSTYVRRVFSDYTFLFNPQFGGGSAGHDNIKTGTAGWGAGSDDWVVHVALHEVAHALGLGESLSEIFAKELLNVQWPDNSRDWVYTTIFDYPLLEAAGRATFFRAAFTSEHAYRTLWGEHFNFIVGYQNLALARMVLFNFHYSNEDVISFIGVDPQHFGYMVFERMPILFQTLVHGEDMSGHTEFNEFIDLLVYFGLNHYTSFAHAVFEHQIYGFGWM